MEHLRKALIAFLISQVIDQRGCSSNEEECIEITDKVTDDVDKMDDAKVVNYLSAIANRAESQLSGNTHAGTELAIIDALSEALSHGAILDPRFVYRTASIIMARTKLHFQLPVHTLFFGTSLFVESPSDDKQVSIVKEDIAIVARNARVCALMFENLTKQGFFVLPYILFNTSLSFEQFVLEIDPETQGIPLPQVGFTAPKQIDWKTQREMLENAIEAGTSMDPVFTDNVDVAAAMDDLEEMVNQGAVLEVAVDFGDLKKITIVPGNSWLEQLVALNAKLNQQYIAACDRIKAEAAALLDTPVEG